MAKVRRDYRTILERNVGFRCEHALDAIRETRRGVGLDLLTKKRTKYGHFGQGTE